MGFPGTRNIKPHQNQWNPSISNQHLKNWCSVGNELPGVGKPEGASLEYNQVGDGLSWSLRFSSDRTSQKSLTPSDEIDWGLIVHSTPEWELVEILAILAEALCEV